MLDEQKIREYYDSHPDLLLSTYARQLGISVERLKRILIDED